MSILSMVLLSGWFHFILLSTIFFIYSQRVLRRGIIRGYSLGWMLGLFFIITYVSVVSTESLSLGASESALNILQVIGAGIFGIFISAGVTITAYFFSKSRIQEALRTAAITGILISAIFLQVVATPDTRLMVSLFVLAFGIASIAGNIMLGHRLQDHSPVSEYPYSSQEDDEQKKPNSHAEMIRSSVERRINMNQVPTDHSIRPTSDQN